MSDETLRIGLSGLLAFQRAIATSSTNVANVDTQGYSRQRVDLAQRGAFDLGSFAAPGAGVAVDAVRRDHDRFLVQEVFLRTSDRESAEVRQSLAGRVADLLGDPDTGLSASVDDLIPALEAAAADPASVATRRALLSTLESTVARFGNFDASLEGLREETLGRIDDALTEIDGLAQRIADLNARIVSTDGETNEFLDARDRFVGELAERVRISTVEADDGSLSVFVDGTQALVVGAVPSALERTSGDPLEIRLSRRGSVADVTDGVRGGRLGALVDSLAGEQEEARGSLDRLALGLALSLNAVHQRGIDLEGNAGGLLLTPGDDPALVGDRTLGERSNGGDAALELRVDDIARIPTTPLRLFFDGADWTLFGPGQTVLETFSTFPQSVTSLGFTIENPSGTAAAGDAFVLRPAAGTARGLAVRVDDPRGLALSAPVDGVADPANAGSASFAELALEELEAGAAATDLPAAVTLTWNESLGAFAVSAPPGGTLAYDAASDAGRRQTLAVPGYGTLAFELGGVPENGDVLSVAARPVGAGDERNGRALVAAMEAGLLEGGRVSLADAPGRTVGDLAAGARGHALDLDAADTLLDRAVAARDTLSGVNLDEEAADLLRFQQAYEANARVIAVSGQLFRSLLSAVGG